MPLLTPPGYTPVAKPSDALRDAGTSPAGTLAGAHLPDGYADSTWAMINASSVWAYTGTAIKPTGGLGIIGAVTDAAGVGGETGKHGRAQMRIVNLSASPAIGLVARCTADGSTFLRFRVSGGVYVLDRSTAGVTTPIYTSTVTAAAGDVIAIEIEDETTISLHVNASVITTLPAPTNLAIANGTRWGIVGSSSNLGSTVADFTWNPA